MAFDKTPTTWLPNWSEDETNIALPLASLPELTAAEADAASGDIRKILYALLEKLHAVYAALPVADRPSRMTIARSSSVNDTTGDITRQYTITLVTEPVAGGIEVKDEPA